MFIPSIYGQNTYTASNYARVCVYNIYIYDVYIHIYIYIYHYPEVDRMWIIHDNAKNTDYNGILLKHPYYVMFYLVQDYYYSYR